jgi:hypothetical protein
MDPLTGTALGLGAAWASGLNVYAVALTLGLLDAAGWIDLPRPLAPLSSPLVLGLAAFLYAIEFVADKVPGVDHVWDAIHTFVRIPAAAILAASAIGAVDPELAIAAALVGGTLAFGSHLTKAAARPGLNLGIPFGGTLVSLAEDSLAIGGVLLAVFFPVLLLILLALVLALTLWLLPKLLRRAGRALARLVRLLRGTADQSPR